MLLKDCHSGILNEAEKKQYFMRRQRGKSSLLKKFVKKQPIASPGIASGKISGSNTRISDMRNCTGPNAIALNATDKAKYKAAMTAALAI